MFYIDLKYAAILGSRLRNFKQTKPHNWNFSCPVCGDSSKNTLRARGYIYPLKSGLLVKCHNCGYGSNIGNFIKYVDPMLYDEYVLERYKGGASKHTDHKSIEDVTDIFKTMEAVKPAEELLEDDILSSLKSLNHLKESHPAVQYAIERQIPRDKWYLLYFCTKFKAYTNTITPKFREPIVEEHPRLIIPYFTNAGKVFAYQGRAFGKEEPKYFTIKVDETQEKIYGLDRIDFSKRVYVVEGPIDSLFLPNCIAVSGASFDTPVVRSLLPNATLVMDNEPRNKEIVKQLGKYIDAGYSVCMFPDTIEQKDINEIILAGKTPQEIVDVINTNTFSGMEAKLKFSEWRKI